MFGFERILTREIILRKQKDANGNYNISFKENSENSKVKKVSFYRFPNTVDIFSFSLDYEKNKGKCKKSYQRLSMHLNIKHGKINKKADIVFILNDFRDVYIFIIDIKSSDYRDSDTECQLYNSEIFINYLSDLLNEYHQASFNATNNVKFIRCVFYPILSLQKPLVTISRAEKARFELRGKTHKYLMVPFKLKMSSNKDEIECTHNNLIDIIREYEKRF